MITNCLLRAQNTQSPAASRRPTQQGGITMSTTRKSMITLTTLLASAAAFLTTVASTASAQVPAPDRQIAPQPSTVPGGDSTAAVSGGSYLWLLIVIALIVVALTLAVITARKQHRTLRMHHTRV